MDRVAAGPEPDGDIVWVPSGTFAMGSDRHYPEEAPAHTVFVAPPHRVDLANHYHWWT
jgi:formylglycine-generating enzyme